MKLSTLLQDYLTLPSQHEREISGLALDSRHIKPQEVFVAFKGTHQDGRQYIESAVANGASAVLIEAEDFAIDTIRVQAPIPIIPIQQLQQKLGFIAARFYDFPAKKLQMIGVTGTSGKTSCTHFIAESWPMRCGLIGTLGSGFYGALGEAGLTTPDAITLQAMLHQFVTQGAKAVAMEVSSHSIDQGRINGIDYEIGIFTNLSQEHLDYHGNMQTYAAIKQRFIAEMPTRQVIINADDAYGQHWLPVIAARKPVIAYSTQRPTISNVTFVYCEDVAFSLEGIRARIYTPWGKGELLLPLIGRFNLSNGLAVLTAMCLTGVSLEEAIERLAKLHTVPGRMQILSSTGKPLVVVDYAHKPDALEKVLQALRGHTRGRLGCVFGCGGERDRMKRPIMAKIAEQWADYVIVTNDNPRHEKPEAIIQEIMQGFNHPEQIKVELDRSKAIENSIQWGAAEDCVLIAGKGAEKYQIFGDEKVVFDDVVEVNKYLGGT